MSRQLHAVSWSGQLDSNQRPAVPKTAALPGCAIPRYPQNSLSIHAQNACIKQRPRGRIRRQSAGKARLQLQIGAACSVFNTIHRG
jgi:hypothetical protein